jgi:hypothetical protein
MLKQPNRDPDESRQLINIIAMDVNQAQSLAPTAWTAAGTSGRRCGGPGALFPGAAAAQPNLCLVAIIAAVSAVSAESNSAMKASMCGNTSVLMCRPMMGQKWP